MSGKHLIGCLLVPLALALTPLVQAQASSVPPAQSASAPVTVAAQLRRLTDAYFIEDLRLNPLYAPAKGVAQFNAQFGDYLSDDYLQAQQALERRYLQQVEQLDRRQLSEADRLSYDAFVYARRTAIRGFAYPYWLLPLSQEVNKAVDVSMQASGDLIYPFETAADYRAFLSRLEGMAAWADKARERLREGSGKGITLSREVAQATATQVLDLVSSDPLASVYAKPLERLPAAIPAQEQARLREAYRDSISRIVNPALQRLGQFLRDDYKARSTLGWNGLPDGSAWYQYLSDQQTSTDMPVEQIYTRGLQEVARIRAEMDAIRAEVGFQGDLPAFFKHLLNDPQFVWRDPKQQMVAFRQIAGQVDSRVPQLFARTPRTAMEIRRVPVEREETDGSAWYSQGSGDGRTPGVFFVNTRPGLGLFKWEMEANYIHEAVPGHHFQISLKQEQTDLPDFRRYLECNGFEEGWALYVESIGPELGVYRDPLQRFGKLNNEMLRALRLVVEPGLHLKGWSIVRAQQYMAENSALTPDYIEYEVLRYLANPGQALSYKVGQLSISDLRREASEQLGSHFDVRQFHDRLISNGTLPLQVVRQSVGDWVASQR